MTLDEVIQEITSEHKFYVGVMPQSSVSLFLKRYREGRVKRKTVIAFIQKFGYDETVAAQYGKVTP